MVMLIKEVKCEMFVVVNYLSIKGMVDFCCFVDKICKIISEICIKFV